MTCSCWNKTKAVASNAPTEFPKIRVFPKLKLVLQSSLKEKTAAKAANAGVPLFV